MTKKILKLFLLLYLLQSRPAISQSYQSMLGDSNEWYHGYLGYSYTYTYLWRTTTDTLIGSYNYKKVERFSTGFVAHNDCDNNCLEGYIREDTSARKVYYINCYPASMPFFCDSVEYLLYDFGKVEGDTVNLGRPNIFPNELIIADIYLDTTLSQSPVFRLRSLDFRITNIIWIPEVGSIAGLELNRFEELFPPGLLCSFKNGLQTFRSTAYNGECIVNWVSANEINSSALIISPNPASNYLSVSISPQYSLHSCHLTDLSGKTILETRETAIPLHSVARGLYFVTVHLTNGQSIVKKVVVE